MRILASRTPGARGNSGFSGARPGRYLTAPVFPSFAV
jgi:hypothetical protein